MMPAQIIPVIMCGGAGTRLWPISRESMPKQFVSLVGPGSTFQQVLARISDSDLFARPIVITIVRTSVLLWRSNYASAVSKPTSCSNRCACLSLCCGRNQERIYKGLTALRSRIRAKWVCWVKKSSLLEPIDLSLFI